MYSIKFSSLIWVYIVTIPAILLLKPVFSELVGTKAFTRRAYAWIMTTATAFLTPDFLTFLFLYSLVLYYFAKQEKNKPALLATLIFSVPAKSVALPDILGFPLFTVTNTTILSIALLLPALLKKKTRESNTNQKINKTALTYIFIFLFAQSFIWADLQAGTHTLRLAIGTALLPFILPLGLIATIKTREEFLHTIYSFLFGVILLAPVGILEGSKQWYLYSDATANWAATTLSGYNSLRDASIRASATFESPIVFGEVLASGLILLLATIKAASRTHILRLYLSAALILGAIYFTRSRSPQIFLASAFLIYIVGAWTAPSKSQKIFLTLLVAFFTLSLTSGIIDPQLFYSDTSSGEYFNITYRNNLANALWNIARTFPFRGYPEIQSLLLDFRQGQGIIDLLNVYLSFAASYGIPVCIMLVMAHVKPITALVRKLPNTNEARATDNSIAWAILSLLIAHAIFIYTMSWLSSISTMTWLLISFCMSATLLKLRFDKLPINIPQ